MNGFKNGRALAGIFIALETTSSVAVFGIAATPWWMKCAASCPRILRFGKIDGAQNASSVTQYDRIVGEFFSVKSGKIQEVQAVLVNRQDSQPTGWDTKWYMPGQGGCNKLLSGQ